jgi:hypothetical protein
MVSRKNIAVIILIMSLCSFTAAAGTVEKDYTSFLHYASIGRLDMAVAHGKSLLAAEPNAVEMLRLTEQNPQGYALLLDMKSRSKNTELVELAGKMLDIIDKGRYTKRNDTRVITDEIDRLSSSARGRITAVERLKDAGEYAVPLMLNAMTDKSRQGQLANIECALEQMDKDAVRPLAAALQTNNAAVKAEIVRALGSIKSAQALPYLKYIVEQNESPSLVSIATNSINEIDRSSAGVSAADLFVSLARSYYSHSDTLAPSVDSDSANVWFWDGDLGQLKRVAVPVKYFNELMAMRCCELALKADANKGEAIGVWLAAFFKAESTKIPMPAYFGSSHADAQTYATIAGPEYVQQALALALADKNTYMSLGLIRALGMTAGENSLMMATSSGQPLIKSLYSDDRQVKYSAAIVMAKAEPKTAFADSILVTQLLAEALSAKAGNDWSAELADKYAMDAAIAMYVLADRGNKVLDLSAAREALIGGTRDSRPAIQTTSLNTLALMDGPDAQRAVAAVALTDSNSPDLKIMGFAALGASAKMHGNLLLDGEVKAIYDLVQSEKAPMPVRSAAAAAYGALNLPSDKARKLLLDQAKN